MLAYALGRRLEFYDEPTVKKIVAAVAEDAYKSSRVVLEVAKSNPFRHRRTNNPRTPNAEAQGQDQPTP